MPENQPHPIFSLPDSSSDHVINTSAANWTTTGSGNYYITATTSASSWTVSADYPSLTPITFSGAMPTNPLSLNDIVDFCDSLSTPGIKLDVRHDPMADRYEVRGHNIDTGEVFSRTFRTNISYMKLSETVIELLKEFEFDEEGQKVLE